MRLVIYFLFIFSLASLKAQNLVDQVLGFPLTQLEMSEVLAKEDFLKTHKFNSPWLREVDFRARSNDREVGLEDYRLRFSFLNPYERKANKDYRSLLLSQQSFERKKTINDALLRRYELLIEVEYLLKSIDDYSEYLQLLSRIREIQISDAIDFSDLIDLEHELTKTELTLAGLNQKKEIIERVLESYGVEGVESSIQFDWLDKSQVTQLLEGDAGETPSMKVQLESQKLMEEETIMKLKKAEAFSNIGFIQAEYDTERGNGLDDHLGFQLGLSIPIFNSDKPDLQRRELEIIENKAELEQLKSTMKMEISLEELRLTELLGQAGVIDQKVVELSPLRKLLDENGAGVSDYRKLGEYELFLKQKQTTFNADIRMKYISLLHQNGKLGDQPYINYLSGSFSTFELEIE